MEQINLIFDGILSPFSDLTSVMGVWLTSLLSALLLLTVFKLVSNQEQIKRHKKKIFGYFLETSIFRDQLGRTVISQLNLLKHNFIYLRYFVAPVLIMIVPISIIGLQIEYRTGYQPLELNKSFNIEVNLDNDLLKQLGSSLDDVRIEVPSTVKLETPALRIYSENRIYWKAKIVAGKTRHWIRIHIEGAEEEITRQLAFTKQVKRFGPTNQKSYSLDEVIYASEPSISQSSAIRGITITYTPTEFEFFLWEIQPVVYFFILTLFFGFLIRPFFKVSI